MFSSQIELNFREAAAILFVTLLETCFISFALKNRAERIEIPQCLLKASMAISSSIEAAMLLLASKKIH